MKHKVGRFRTPRPMKTEYPSDLTDSEWTYLQRHLPAALARRCWPQHSLRTVLDAIALCYAQAAHGAGALRAVFAWLVRNRRLRIGDERKVQTSETLVEVACIRLPLRRLARDTE